MLGLHALDPPGETREETLAEITCARCKKTGEPPTDVTWGGDIGEAITTRICASCWEAWEAFSVKLVNEYGLSMGNREHYETYVKHLREFLELDTAK